MYEDVNYKGKAGSLTLNDKVFHYQANNTKTSVKCSWVRVEKRQLSPETANQNMIKLVLVSGKTAVFTVKNRVVLEEMRNDMQNRMDAAKTRIEDPGYLSTTQIPAAGNDETDVVNIATYHPDYVKRCTDNALRYAAMHKNFKDAAEDLKRGLENLKLYPDHKLRSINESKSHEEKADYLFKANEFENAYINYQKAIDALAVKEWPDCQRAKCLLLVVICAPLVIFMGLSGCDNLLEILGVCCNCCDCCISCPKRKKRYPGSGKVNQDC